jgi:hypothetical protein
MKSILRIVTVCILLINSSVVFSQADSAKLRQNIKAGADSMQSLFKTKDWNKYADFMHPQILMLVGNRENFINLVTQQMELLKSASVDSMKTGNVLQLLNHNGEWQCVLETFMQMTVDSTTVSMVSTNIGVSADNGVTWKFFRVSDGNETTMIEIVPALSPLLKIPLNQNQLTTLDVFLKEYKVKYPNSTENSKATD